MASANVELVRSMHAAWERGDWAYADWADPDIEFVIEGGPDAGRWRGVGAMGKVWREYLDNWEDYRIVVERYRELDDERVLVLMHNAGRSRTSGVEVEQIAAKVANLVHIHGGKVTRLVTYWDRDRALADLGLEE